MLSQCWRLGNCIWGELYEEVVDILEAELERDDYVSDDPVPANHIDENIEAPEASAEEEILRDTHTLLGRYREERGGTPYEDEKFPAAMKSVFRRGMSVPSQFGNIEWKRPHELHENPQLFVDGINDEDVVQGYLSDCWFVTACTAISRSKELMEKVIPPGQTLSPSDGKYTGAVFFRLWRFGRWVDVVVDDRLPVLVDDDRRARLVFARSRQRNEYWCSLLEKAYAKLHGCYKSLDFGLPHDALVDLTGGMAVAHSLVGQPPSNLQSILSRALRNETFVCAALSGTPASGSGLYADHAYTVLDFATITLTTGKQECIVKIRNPYGGDNEWNNRFSDSSAVWNHVTEADKAELGVVDRENGQWWMSYEDFVHHFTKVTMCTLGPDFDADGTVLAGDRWKLSSITEVWRGSSEKSPQVFLDIRKPDNFDPQGKATILIGLMQKNRRSRQLKDLPIKLFIYKSTSGRTRRHGSCHLSSRRNLVDTSGEKYMVRREVTLTTELRPGAYVIVAAALQDWDEGRHTEFLVRVYTENDFGKLRLLR